MKIYTGDWLTNAALVGYLRIQDKAGVKPLVRDGYVEIKDEDLKYFTDAYFVAVLEQYMNNSFVINKQNRIQLTKKLKEDQKQCRQKIDDFTNDQNLGLYNYKSYKTSSKNQADSLKKYKDNLKKFLLALQKEFGIDKKTIESVLKANNKKIDDKIDAISGKSQAFLPNSLQRFYFNKAIVGNYSISKKTTRYDAFKGRFLQGALSALKDDTREGHITCKICKQNKILIKSFEENLLNEAMFSSTMVSDRKFSNFFYNGQSDLFICNICELVLLCSWAGFNQIPLNARDGTSDTDYIFLNLPDITMSLRQNNNIRKIDDAHSYRFKDTIYSQTIQKMLTDRQVQKSRWAMENLFFVEIKTVSRKNSGKPNFVYYSIGKNIASLLTDDLVIKALGYIRGTITTKNKTKLNLATQTIKAILEQRPFDNIRNIICDEMLKNNTSRSRELFNISLISSIRNVNNLQHRSGVMSTTRLDPKIIFGALKGLQTNGKNLALKIKSSKKTKANSFVLLEAVRNNNIEKFYDIISKLYITNNIPIPENMVAILNRFDVITPHERAYAFLSGFSSTGEKTDD